MDRFGPITNTRSVDDALRDAVRRMKAAPPSRKLDALLAEARRYQEVVASWELIPPVPEEQFETIGEIMGLLATCMNAAPDPGPCAAGQAEVEPQAAGTELELEDFGPSTPPLSPQVQVGRVNIGRLPSSAPPGGDGVFEVVHPHQRPWQPSPASPAVRLKVVRVEDDGLRRHLLVRLEDGASLPPHQASSAELILVVDGALRAATTPVHAGCFVHVAAGDLCPRLTAEGETTLMFIGSERSFST